MKNYRTLFLMLFATILFVFSTNKIYSQTKETKRAIWVFNIAQGVTWENQKDLKKITIGVFSSKKEFLELQKLASLGKIDGKPVEVIYYSTAKEVTPNHIVYVTRNENANLGFIYQKLQNKNVLVISDRSKSPQYSVININKEGAEQPFSINNKMYRKQRLKFSTQLYRIGGDRASLKMLQAQSNKLFQEEQKLLLEESKKATKMSEELLEAKEEIKKLKAKIAKLEAKIKQ